MLLSIKQSGDVAALVMSNVDDVLSSWANVDTTTFDETIIKRSLIIYLKNTLEVSVLPR